MIYDFIFSGYGKNCNYRPYDHAYEGKDLSNTVDLSPASDPISDTGDASTLDANRT